MPVGNRCCSVYRAPSGCIINSTPRPPSATHQLRPASPGSSRSHSRNQIGRFETLRKAVGDWLKGGDDIGRTALTAQQAGEARRSPRLPGQSPLLARLTERRSYCHPRDIRHQPSLSDGANQTMADFVNGLLSGITCI